MVGGGGWGWGFEGRVGGVGEEAGEEVGEGERGKDEKAGGEERKGGYLVETIFHLAKRVREIRSQPLWLDVQRLCWSGYRRWNGEWRLKGGKRRCEHGEWGEEWEAVAKFKRN